jgi:hypothetical protein
MLLHLHNESPPAGANGRTPSLRPAERVGFEPTVGTSPTTVFETVPFNHSGTSPMGAAHYTKRALHPMYKSSNRPLRGRLPDTHPGRRSGP